MSILFGETFRAIAYEMNLLGETALFARGLPARPLLKICQRAYFPGASAPKERIPPDPLPRKAYWGTMEKR